MTMDVAEPSVFEVLTTVAMESPALNMKLMSLLTVRLVVAPPNASSE